MTLPSVADSVEPAGATVGSGPPEEATRRSVGADLFRSVLRNKKALVGLGLLLVFVVLAAIPGQIAPDNPTGEGLPARARAVAPPPVRDDRLRRGRLLAARLRDASVAPDRTARRRPGDGDRGGRRRLRRLPRRHDRRDPLADHRRDPGDPDLPADHRDRGLRAELRAVHARDRARRARLVVRRQAAALADALVTHARLPRGGPRARRAQVVRDRPRDPADDDLADPGELPRRRALRRALRRRPAVHRARRPEQPELGDDALLGREQRGARGRDAATGRSCPASASPSSARRSRCSTTRSTRSRAPRCGCASSSGRASTRTAPRSCPRGRRTRRTSSKSGTSRSPTPPSTGRWSRSTTSSFELAKGEFLGVVGESACGKSTLVYAIARLLGAPLAGEITNGQVLFKGQDMVTLSDKQLRHIRWRDYSVVMQSAMNALNPVLTIGAQMRDACEAHSTMSKRQIEGRSKEVLRLVSIDPVHLLSYPHQLSGGMRQRAMIAMALLFTPELIVMDEPTSALDVVGQRSLMVQIKELQEQLGFAVIFVTHDMSLVRHFSDRLLVMYAAQVAELGRTRQLFEKPLHPYTHGLLDAFPSIHGAEGAPARDPGHASRPAAAPGRLPLRAALPARVRALPGRAAAAARGRRRARPLLPARARRAEAVGREGESSRERAAAAGRGPDAPLPRREAVLPPDSCTRSTTSTSSIGQRRDRRARRRERQRQEHDRPPARARVQADRRRDLLRGQAA